MGSTMTDDAQQPQEKVVTPSDPPSELAGEVLPIPPSVLESTSTSRSATPIGTLAEDISGAREEFTRHVHAYVNDYVRFADEKAAFIVTFASASLAFLHTQNLLPALGLDVSLIGLLRFLAATGLGLSILFAMWVVLPRRRGGSQGLVFWLAIAARQSPEAYESSLRTASREVLESELERHTHEVSVVCAAKYQRLAWAMYIGCVGVFASVGLIMLDRK